MTLPGRARRTSAATRTTERKPPKLTVHCTTGKRREGPPPAGCVSLVTNDCVSPCATRHNSPTRRTSDAVHLRLTWSLHAVNRQPPLRGLRALRVFYPFLSPTISIR